MIADLSKELQALTDRLRGIRAPQAEANAAVANVRRKTGAKPQLKPKRKPK